MDSRAFAIESCSGAADDFQTLQEALARFDYIKSLLLAERGDLAYSAIDLAEFERRNVEGMFSPSLFGDIPDLINYIK